MVEENEKVPLHYPLGRQNAWRLPLKLERKLNFEVLSDLVQIFTEKTPPLQHHGQHETGDVAAVSKLLYKMAHFRLIF